MYKFLLALLAILAVINLNACTHKARKRKAQTAKTIQLATNAGTINQKKNK